MKILFINLKYWFVDIICYIYFELKPFFLVYVYALCNVHYAVKKFNIP